MLVRIQGAERVVSDPAGNDHIVIGQLSQGFRRAVIMGNVNMHLAVLEMLEPVFDGIDHSRKGNK